jgi:hypothetical protein
MGAVPGDTCFAMVDKFESAHGIEVLRATGDGYNAIDPVKEAGKWLRAENRREAINNL